MLVVAWCGGMNMTAPGLCDDPLLKRSPEAVNCYAEDARRNTDDVSGQQKAPALWPGPCVQAFFVPQVGQNAAPPGIAKLHETQYLTAGAVSGAAGGADVIGTD